jgi:phosphopantetheine adenylyltransferase
MEKTKFKLHSNIEAIKYYKGNTVAFIKSRKEKRKIYAMEEEMIEFAKEVNLELSDVIVDDSPDIIVDIAHHHAWTPEILDNSESNQE